MKSRLVWKWNLSFAFTALPLAGGCVQESNSPPPVQTFAAATVEAVSPPADLLAATPDETTPGAGTVPSEAALADAAVQPISTPKPPPPEIRLTAPASQVLTLANSGVDEGVMLAFVTNSAGTFNLGASEIVYLNDIGVPAVVVSAMIQRDQSLKKLSGNPAAVPVYVAPTNQPVPAEVAPQAVYTTEPYPAPPPDVVTDAEFSDALAPYGTWVNVAGYGPCWQPTVVVVNPGWQPYFDCGHWVYTDCGWYWMSDYSWGWAPFHYGRWFRHHHLGWCWAPDRVWGPSWVSWRYSNDYCGWAPLPPGAGYRPGFGFTYYGQSVGFNFGFSLGWDRYAFVGWNHFHDRHLQGHALPGHEASRVFHQTTVVNNMTADNHRTIINEGIPPARMPAAQRQELRRVTISEVKGGPPRIGRAEHVNPRNNTLTVYKPVMPDPSRANSTISQPPRTELRGGHAPAVAPARPPTLAEGAWRRPSPGSHLAAPKDEPQTQLGWHTSPTPSHRPPAASTHPASAAPVVRPDSAITAPPGTARNRPSAVTSSQPSAPSSAWLPSAQTPPRASTPGGRLDPPARTERPPTTSRPGTTWPATGWQTRNSAPGNSPTPWLAPRPSSPPAHQTPARTTPSETPRQTFGPSPSRPTYSAPPTVPRSPSPESRSAPAKLVVEVPRYSPPATTAPRSFSAPMPAVRAPAVESRPAPARPAVSEAPRFAPPPAASAPARAPAMDSRPSSAPSSAAPSSRGNAGRGRSN